jgi:hypothetical protein
MRTTKRSISRLVEFSLLSASTVAMSSVAVAECINTNTCFGEGALSTPVGNGNSAFGFETLATDQSAGFNTAVGYVALSSNLTGFSNTAVGERALFQNTDGESNTAVGSLSLAGNKTGSFNVAIGLAALVGNTTGAANVAVGLGAINNGSTGSNNTAIGTNALDINHQGNKNTAVGASALRNIDGGSLNTATGSEALEFARGGSRNVALGYRAGRNVSNGSNNIIIGAGVFGTSSDNHVIRIGSNVHQRKAFVAGIRGATTGLGNATAVVIDGNGQLGTINSSRAAKENVKPMGTASARVSKLRPVTFQYREPYGDGSQPVEFGLIAEEVAEIFPELVVLGTDGKPETVAYHKLPTLLLNELQAVQELNRQQSAELAIQAGRLAEVAELKRRVEEMTALLAALQSQRE